MARPLILLLLASLAACAPLPPGGLPLGTPVIRPPFFQATGTPGPVSPQPVVATLLPRPTPSAPLTLPDAGQDGVRCEDGTTGSGGALHPLADVSQVTFARTPLGGEDVYLVEVRFSQSGDYLPAVQVENPFLLRAAFEVYTDTLPLLADADWFPDGLSQRSFHFEWDPGGGRLVAEASILTGAGWAPLEGVALDVAPSGETVTLAVPARFVPAGAFAALAVVWWDPGSNSPICDFAGLGENGLPAVRLP